LEFAFDKARRETRIVGQHRVDANQYGIVRSPELVSQNERALTTERERLTRARGDATVHALRVTERDEGATMTILMLCSSLEQKRYAVICP
jgi:hypothetical protein